MPNTLQPFQFYAAENFSTLHKLPYSDEYGDIYFNPEAPLAETEYVFIQGNELVNNWQNKSSDHCFVIAETGFGTGLNFLATIKAWQAAANKPEKLHFISFEKHPLSLESLKVAHHNFPELAQLSARLQQLWQTFGDQFRAGLHRLAFSNEVTLTVGMGDATANLQQLNAAVDAWFLDGFAPDKNPAMWHQDLFAHINRLSKTGTTLATFSAAGHIKRKLLNHGFAVRKIPGFGKKREMITAQCTEPIDQQPNKQPWHPCPAASGHKKVTIIGAGIAGMTLAWQLKRAGYAITMIEQHDEPMRQASGNPMAMVMPLITAKNSPETQFYARAFDAARRFYTKQEFHRIGLEQWLSTAQDLQWAQTIKQAALPENHINFTKKNRAFYPQAGFVETRLLAQRLKSAVDVWLNFSVNKLQASAENSWQLLDQHGNVSHECDLVVLANGIHANQMHEDMSYQLTAKHGMTSCIQAPHPDLKHLQLAAGYIIPDAKKQRWLLGASFDHLPESKWYEPAQLDQRHWQSNSDLWRDHAVFTDIKQAQVISGHAGIRATTKDHLPICGPVINGHQFRMDYHDLHHGRHWQTYPPAPVHKNLYVLNGLGARGYTSAPLLADYLCAMISAEPLPLEADLCKIIHPNRFLYRQLKKPPN